MWPPARRRGDRSTSFRAQHFRSAMRLRIALIGAALPSRGAHAFRKTSRNRLMVIRRFFDSPAAPKSLVRTRVVRIIILLKIVKKNVLTVSGVSSKNGVPT